MFKANNLPTNARKICKKSNFTPRFFERLNADKPLYDDGVDYPVYRVWNSRREIIITSSDMEYASRYL